MPSKVTASTWVPTRRCGTEYSAEATRIVGRPPMPGQSEASTGRDPPAGRAHVGHERDQPTGGRPSSIVRRSPRANETAEARNRFGCPETGVRGLGPCYRVSRFSSFNAARRASGCPTSLTPCRSRAAAEPAPQRFRSVHRFVSIRIHTSQGRPLPSLCGTDRSSTARRKVCRSSPGTSCCSPRPTPTDRQPPRGRVRMRRPPVG